MNRNATWSGEWTTLLHTISEILVKRETIEKEHFEALLAGKTEEEVFGPDQPPVPPQVPGAQQPADRREHPRPLPRPGLAGGGVEARGRLELPEKPELA